VPDVTTVVKTVEKSDEVVAKKRKSFVDDEDNEPDDSEFVAKEAKLDEEEESDDDDSDVEIEIEVITISDDE